MPLELVELKRMHDKDYVSGQLTRELASGDLVFYWLTQWDDETLSESPLAYRGKFNIIRKAGRQIEADLVSNPVQADFEPIGETGEDAAETLDGIYRTDDNYNTSIEAYDVAKQEAVVCGFGAWELYTEYQTMGGGDRDQVIRRRPINEANNVVLFDSNAKRLDKSDANRCSVLVPYTEEGYIGLVKDLTGEEVTVTEGSFKSPAQSFLFPWFLGGTDNIIWVTNFYHREKIKTKIYTLTDSFGDSVQVWEKELNEGMDDLIDAGYSIESEKEVQRWEVTKYIASGASILSSDVIAGQHIPVVPMYGEHAYVEGGEHYEGITRLAQDPQRLRNFMLSYIADIAAQSPRQKPIFNPEQIMGHEHMYEIAGADNQYPYVLQNRKSVDGEDLPIGPVAIMPEQKIPDSLMAMTALTREAVEDVANPGLFRDLADPEVSRVVSGRAILALQARLDMQSMIYQEHSKHAKRRDAEVYASMASEIYDVPGELK